MSPVSVFAATPAELDAAQQQLESGLLDATLKSQGSGLTFCKDGNGSVHDSTFSPVVFFPALRSKTLGRVLLTSQRATSTQSLLQDSLRSLPDGVVFVADKQTIGKGRGGNVWESPAGCLMVSAAMRLSMPGQRLPFLQYLVSMAVVEAVREEAARCFQADGSSDKNPPPLVDVRLKWPNDLYADGQKIGGVLCHSTYRERSFHLVWGLGLNVANPMPTTCLDDLLARSAAARGVPPPRPVRPETLLASLLGWLEPAVERLAVEGFDPFRAAYLSSWLHSGQSVELEEGPTRVAMVVEGLTRDGYLLARDVGGQPYELHPDGNSLDFFQGLVRKKLPA